MSFKAIRGLVVAEVELSVHEHLELPKWIGEEVTGDIRYYNRTWQKSAKARDHLGRLNHM